MKVLTFDLETENHESNKRKAAPFDQRNYIVEAGWSWNGGEVHSQRFNEWHREDIMNAEFDKLEKGDLIVGFNIKFDLLWVWHQKSLQAALKRGALIYCGQYAEYLLGGMVQEVQMVAMNDVAELYGGGCKIDAVKEMWEEGYLTSEIPPDLLHDYLVGDGKEIVGDVRNTWLIFRGQIARMNKSHPKEFRTMLKMRMEGLLATIEMEYNGVYADAIHGETLRLKLVKDIAAAKEHLDTFIPKLPEELVFNWGSSQMKSCLIFGGTVKYEKWVPHKDDDGNFIYAQKKESWPLFNGDPYPEGECLKAGSVFVRVDQNGSIEYKGKRYSAQDTYKSGKQAGLGKFKQMTVPDLEKKKGAKKPHYFTFDGYTKGHHTWLGTSTDAYDQPLYSVGAKVIETLAKRNLAFTDALSQYTSMDKDLGTYYWKEDKKGKRKGMLTLLADDGIIHHKLNHTSTVTSRLSSSDPNLQNIPRGSTSNVKQMFTSRFVDGYMAEIDYSQLEVVIQGVLSQDINLCNDLRNRVDFHCKRLAKKRGEPYEDVIRKAKVEEIPEYVEGRTLAKVFSFQRAYGAGAATIAEDTGMPKSEIEEFIRAEEIMYPGITDFDRRLEATIAKNRSVMNTKLFIEGVAFSKGESYWDSPTGTRYVWREDVTPQFMHASGKYTGFSPTERKNYPVQGFGGEVVQAMIGKVFRFLLENDRFNNEVLLVNTVHDCVWLDGANEEVTAKVAKQVQSILESVPEVFNEAFPELNVTVPFPCETEIGKDMFDMKVLH